MSQSPETQDGMFVLDRSTFNRTGRCGTCRSWISDLDASGTCYACAALAVGDLLACVHCDYWIPRDEIRRPCGYCGGNPLAP